jgi:diaminohydroxyphosphoribosylaminopyrimidine deaminase / 5-amino-6-(5-phosphoribosylamino)uracil reductase
MPENTDAKFMQRCLELAVRAEGYTYPNPMVGAIIVHNNRIIGEGYHLKAGEPHAEVFAVNRVAEKGLLNESTMYVNLEPCSHTGRTPPCADLILTHKIPRVIIGTVDTSDKVSGKGIRRLKDAGVEVITGILEEESRFLNRRFFTFHEQRRPYIILKWAESSDGFIDIMRNEGQSIGPTWITGKPERILVHRWRSNEQAILAGAETIRKDNPQLNVREWEGHDPMKLILSSSGKLDDELAVYNTGARVIIFTNERNAVFPNGETILLDKNIHSGNQILDYLYQIGIQSMIIEGGTQILNHFISEGLWDEARIFTGSKKFHAGVKSPVIEGMIDSIKGFSSSSLKTVYKSKNS